MIGALAAALEPTAAAAASGTPALSTIEVAALSTAISLKRLADALDASRPQAGLYGLAEDLAFHAGQAFERGRGAA